MPFIPLRKLSSIPNLLKIFIMLWFWCFLYLLRYSWFFLKFAYIKLFYFWNLNSYFLEVNSVWLLCIITFVNVFNILLRLFCIHINEEYWPEVFLSYCFLILVFYLYWPHKMLENVTFFCIFWKNLFKMSIISFLNIW